MNTDKMSHNTMDKKTRLIVAKSLKDMIMNADLAQLDVNYGVEETIDQRSGYPKYAHNGRITVFLELYISKIDKRKELYTNCSNEVVE